MELDSKTIERIIVGLTIACLSVTLIDFSKEEKVINTDPVITEDSFDKFPLVAWKSTHERYDCKDKIQSNES